MLFRTTKPGPLPTTGITLPRPQDVLLGVGHDLDVVAGVVHEAAGQAVEGLDGRASRGRTAGTTVLRSRPEVRVEVMRFKHLDALPRTRAARRRGARCRGRCRSACRGPRAAPARGRRCRAARRRARARRGCGCGSRAAPRRASRPRGARGPRGGPPPMAPSANSRATARSTVARLRSATAWSWSSWSAT